MRRKRAFAKLLRPSYCVNTMSMIPLIIFIKDTRFYCSYALNVRFCLEAQSEPKPVGVGCSAWFTFRSVICRFGKRHFGSNEVVGLPSVLTHLGGTDPNTRSHRHGRDYSPPIFFVLFIEIGWTKRPFALLAQKTRIVCGTTTNFNPKPNFCHPEFIREHWPVQNVFYKVRRSNLIC